ncbi:hypothetical protein CLOSTMETH_01236 [[Clostridium] methylpentosum DSM 5476]|uniref:Uncharacterized protein n=1 Tax=[Clostridium] methylpentosum DSM 5476 TaxID=537013 RepID=C0EBL8_9FIRM|nr:hypothetical protein CLOSTMETH_01236 [[Clostridium] methylpentosum DSM 5476]
MIQYHISFYNSYAFSLAQIPDDLLNVFLKLIVSILPSIFRSEYDVVLAYPRGQALC